MVHFLVNQLPDSNIFVGFDQTNSTKFYTAVAASNYGMIRIFHLEYGMKLKLVKIRMFTIMLTFSGNIFVRCKPLIHLS